MCVVLGFVAMCLSKSDVNDSIIIHITSLCKTVFRGSWNVAQERFPVSRATILKKDDEMQSLSREVLKSIASLLLADELVRFCTVNAAVGHDISSEYTHLVALVREVRGQWEALLDYLSAEAELEWEWNTRREIPSSSPDSQSDSDIRIARYRYSGNDFSDPDTW